MDEKSLNIPKNYQRYFAVFAVLVFVLLSSCPVKNSIKNLAGIPANTEQGLAKSNHSLFGNISEKCANSETTDTKISQTISFQINNLLPAVILTAAFLFFFSYTLYKKPAHPFYGNLKTSSAIPIFLEYRKLII